MSENKDYKEKLANKENPFGNAPGGRSGDSGNAVAPTSNYSATEAPISGNQDPAKKVLDDTFGIEHKDVKGSLRLHIKLDLDVDIKIIARIKGDIAIGLL